MNCAIFWEEPSMDQSPKSGGLLGDDKRDENLLDPQFGANPIWLKVAYKWPKSGLKWLSSPKRALDYDT